MEDELGIVIGCGYAPLVGSETAITSSAPMSAGDQPAREIVKPPQRWRGGSSREDFFFGGSGVAAGSGAGSFFSVSGGGCCGT
jgi:hypothetical protein